jgi:hypothetical protein
MPTLSSRHPLFKMLDKTILLRFETEGYPLINSYSETKLFCSTGNHIVMLADAQYDSMGRPVCPIHRQGLRHHSRSKKCKDAAAKRRKSPYLCKIPKPYNERVSYNQYCCICGVGIKNQTLKNRKPKPDEPVYCQNCYKKKFRWGNRKNDA